MQLTPMPLEQRKQSKRHRRLVNTPFSARGRAHPRGFFLVASIIMLMVVAVMAAGFVLVVLAHTRVLGDEHRRTVALNLAEAGVEVGLAKLQRRSDYRGERGLKLADGTIDIVVTRKGTRFALNSVGRVQGPSREITTRVRVAGRYLPFGPPRVETWQEFGR